MKINLSEIINKAFKITFKNKWLWVFGMLVAVGSGGFNMSGDIGRLGDLGDKLSKKNQTTTSPYNQIPVNSIDSTKRVLGAQTSMMAETLYTSANISAWVLIGLAVLTIVGLGIGISTSARAWAEGSLIYGIKEEGADNPQNITQMSRSGRGHFWPILKLNLLYLVLFAIAGLFALILFILSSLSALGMLITVPLALLFGLIFIVVAIAATLIIEIAKIAVIFENLEWKAAYFAGVTITKKFLVDVVVLRFVNCLITSVASIASCLVVAVFVILIALSGALTVAVPFLAVVTAPFIFIFILAFITLLSVIGGIISVYDKATWVLFYEQVRALNQEVQNAV